MKYKCLEFQWVHSENPELVQPTCAAQFNEEIKLFSKDHVVKVISMVVFPGKTFKFLSGAIETKNAMETMLVMIEYDHKDQ